MKKILSLTLLTILLVTFQSVLAAPIVIDDGGSGGGGYNDTIPPSMHFTFDLNETFYIPFNVDSTFPSCSATDNYDPIVDCTYTTTFVNNQTLGPFQITYTAEDDSGNISNPITIQGEVVRDLDAPVMSIDTSLSETIILPAIITDFEIPDCEANDNYDKYPTCNIVHNVNLDVPGDYTIHYSSTDRSGNTSDEFVDVKVYYSQETMWHLYNDDYDYTESFGYDGESDYVVIYEDNESHEVPIEIDTSYFEGIITWTQHETASVNTRITKIEPTILMKRYEAFALYISYDALIYLENYISTYGIEVYAENLEEIVQSIYIDVSISAAFLVLGNIISGALGLSELVLTEVLNFSHIAHLGAFTLSLGTGWGLDYLTSNIYDEELYSNAVNNAMQNNSGLSIRYFYDDPPTLIPALDHPNIVEISNWNPTDGINRINEALDYGIIRYYDTVLLKERLN